jgi:hypothetical protein
MNMNMTESILIQNTTQAQREKIVQDSLGITDGFCDGCASGLIDMYDDYIYGERELSEINHSFRAAYVTGDQDKGEIQSSCSMQ